jgi:hypothetical protein
LGTNPRATGTNPRNLGTNPKAYTVKSSSWATTAGTYIAAQAHIAGADQVAVEMESKWGAGRLRLLVTAELTEKFDRQRYLFNQAIWHGDLEAVRRESGRMCTAWRALDSAAEKAGKNPMAREVWEVTLEDGTVAAIVRDKAHAGAVIGEGRKVAVYTLEEIAGLLAAYRGTIETKLTFPGATVTAVRTPHGDPLDRFADTDLPLDAVLDDPVPHFGGA